MGCSILFLRSLVLPHQPVIPPEFSRVTPQSVRFKATDGVWLGGWKILSDPARPWLILCHGLGTNRADLFPLAEALAASGFNLFLFDFRAHGESQGRLTSLGWREQRDLEGALAFLGAQEDVPDRRYGLLGVSMGAAVGLMVAARDERIGAVVAEGSYVSLDAALRQELRLRSLPVIPCLWFLRWTYRLWFGARVSRISPAAVIAQISPRPVLLIHGGLDHRVPAGDAQRLADATGQPKVFWTVPHAAHLGACQVDPEAYLGKIVSFFESNLA